MFCICCICILLFSLFSNLKEEQGYISPPIWHPPVFVPMDHQPLAVPSEGELILYDLYIRQLSGRRPKCHPSSPRAWCPERIPFSLSTSGRSKSTGMAGMTARKPRMPWQKHTIFSRDVVVHAGLFIPHTHISCLSDPLNSSSRTSFICEHSSGCQAVHLLLFLFNFCFVSPVRFFSLWLISRCYHCCCLSLSIFEGTFQIKQTCPNENVHYRWHYILPFSFILERERVNDSSATCRKVCLRLSWQKKELLLSNFISCLNIFVRAVWQCSESSALGCQTRTVDGRKIFTVNQKHKQGWLWGQVEHLASGAEINVSFIHSPHS